MLVTNQISNHIIDIQWVYRENCQPAIRKKEKGIISLSLKFFFLKVLRLTLNQINLNLYFHPEMLCFRMETI